VRLQAAFFDIDGTLVDSNEALQALASSSNENEVGYHTQLLGVGEPLETSTSKRARWRPAIRRTREIERIDHYFSE